MSWPVDGGDYNTWGPKLLAQVQSVIDESGGFRPGVEADMVQKVLDVVGDIEGVITSVNGETGAVTITADGLGALTSATVAAVTDTLYPAKGPTETALNVLQQSVTYTNLRSEGLSLDGTTDETVAFHAAIDAASAGTVLVLDERAHLRVSPQTAWTGKRLNLLGYGDATIESTAIIDAPLIRVTDAADTRIEGITLQGAETVFANTVGTQHWAVQLDTCDRAVLARLAASGFSRGANVFSSDDVTVDGWSYIGMATGGMTNMLNHMGLRFLQSLRPRASNVTGKNCGSALYAANGSTGGRAWGIDAINCWDNGVYVNDDEWDVGGLQAVMTVDPGATTNTGAKARGSRNKLHHSHAEGMSSGFVLTGLPGTVDAEGAEGSGSALERCTVQATTRHGVIIESSDGAGGTARLRDPVQHLRGLRHARRCVPVRAGAGSQRHRPPGHRQQGAQPGRAVPGVSHPGCGRHDPPHRLARGHEPGSQSSQRVVGHALPDQLDR